MTRKLLFALTLLLCVGCHKEAIEHTGDNPDGSIVFRIQTEDAGMKADAPQTKGTPQPTLEKYDSVCVNVFSHTSDYDTPNGDVAFFRTVGLKQVGQDWKCNPSMIWPQGKMLSFFAYASDIPFEDAGISFSPEEGVPDHIIYTVPSTVTNQPDLFVATKYDQPQTDDVFLTMKHALACVSFCGAASEIGTYVKSITLRNVYGKGSLALDDSTITWEVDPDSKNLTVLEPGIKPDEELVNNPSLDNNYLMTANGYLMMIPQKLTNAAIDVLYWNGQDETDNKVMTYMLPVDDELKGTWKPGMKYIYKFSSMSEEDITVVYYEKYADDSYGLYYYDKESVLQTSLVYSQKIVEAGYGVMSKKSTSSVVPIRLMTHSSTPTTSGTVVPLPELDSYLYPVSQSGVNTFNLPANTTPVDVYFNNSNKSCGMIVPHFAKGVCISKTAMTDHAIRTPQQMRNITWSGASPSRGNYTYTQELDLDFSQSSIGGDNLKTAVVDREFNDVFDGQNLRIENVTINATIANGALFRSNRGEIKNVLLLNSSITSSGNTGGITATNESDGVITHPRIIGEKGKQVVIQGTAGYVGAIVGLNHGRITGTTVIDDATELPEAEVAGWVSIKGASQPVGGIAGQNEGTITTCLLQGIFVTGQNKGDVEIAKITIEGGDYVGGIVGVNRKLIDGNYSGSGATLQAEPDVAGLVSISGNDWVGGIAGENSGVLNQVNVRLGHGDQYNKLTITGRSSVGGIVGYNKDGGTLKADGSSFISVRGNVMIQGVSNVGGIVGNNNSGNISNCFVYNFYSQKAPMVHYAPTISGHENVGGIVGYAATGQISNCAVFSTVSFANAQGEDITNAMAEIKITTSSGGGIVGHCFAGSTIANCYVLGNVKIHAEKTGDEMPKNCGGIVGENEKNTSISSVHIGNNDAEVTKIYNNLFYAVRLPVKDLRMKTNGGVMTSTSGTPTVFGYDYVGGICGVNWGTVDGVSIKDNVTIGSSTGVFVGGIAGGNGQNATIKNCKTYNPTASTSVNITGTNQIGGIVGLNNGIVDNCQLGLSGDGSSSLITIKGVDRLGGIAGSNGGVKTGNAETRITNSKVYGKVLIEATGSFIGGIVGENGITNRVIDCSVIGYRSSYTSMYVYNYDITLKGYGTMGGIAGTNYGDIHGSSETLTNKVTHTAVVASNWYAGGLVGEMKSTKVDGDVAKLYYCDVSHGVLIYTWNTVTGAFAGQIEGVDATEDNPTLFGTASGGPTNKIYIGAETDPLRVRVDGNNSLVKFPPPMGDLLFPPEPPTQGNLWASYQMWNYLYWTAY